MMQEVNEHERIEGPDHYRECMRDAQLIAIAKIAKDGQAAPTRLSDRLGEDSPYEKRLQDRDSIRSDVARALRSLRPEPGRRCDDVGSASPVQS
jgi:hypothetical protein